MIPLHWRLRIIFMSHLDFAKRDRKKPHDFIFPWNFRTEPSVLRQQLRYHKSTCARMSWERKEFVHISGFHRVATDCSASNRIITLVVTRIAQIVFSKITESDWLFSNTSVILCNSIVTPPLQQWIASSNLHRRQHPSRHEVRRMPHVDLASESFVIAWICILHLLELRRRYRQRESRRQL